MPLQDHFHGRTRQPLRWTSLHRGWSMYIAQQLNRHALPSGYQALPQLHLGSQGQVEGATEAVASSLYAIAYHAGAGDDERSRLEMWPTAFQIGGVWPVPPLCIAPARAVPLDREPSYQAACEVLRMP